MFGMFGLVPLFWALEIRWLGGGGLYSREGETFIDVDTRLGGHKRMNRRYLFPWPGFRDSSAALW